MMVPFTNNAVIVNDHTPHKRICTGKAQPFSGQFKTTAHVYFVFLSQPDIALFLILNYAPGTRYAATDKATPAKGTHRTLSPR
jgi:hypothetical protein